MQALGFIETIGLVAATEAADSALKAASVSLLGKKSVGSGYFTVIITGDVAAVKSAVDAGVESAKAIGQVIAAQVIASPHTGLERAIMEEPLIPSRTILVNPEEPKPAPAAPKAAPAPKGAPKRKSPGV